MDSRIAFTALFVFILIFAAAAHAQMLAATTASGEAKTENSTLDVESFFSNTNETDVSNMTYDDLRTLYMNYIRMVDMILEYLNVPPEERPYPFNKTDAELYALQSTSLMMAQNLSSYINLYNITETQNETPSLSLNGTGMTANETTAVPVKNQTDFMLSNEDIAAREEMIRSIKTDEWLNYSSHTEFRRALGYVYEKPEIQKTVTDRYSLINVSVIDAGRAVKIDVGGQEQMPLTTIDMAVNTQSRNLEIKVERAEAPEVPNENLTNVYSYLKIEKSMITDNEIEDVGLEFVVSRSWLDAEGINYSDVRLFRLENGWRELPTRKITEDYSNVYYEAISPGLSYFAIGITANLLAPLEVEIPSKKETPLEGSGTQAGSGKDDIVIIRFSWVLVLVVIFIVLMLRYTYITGRIKGLLKRESEDDLTQMLDDYRNQMNEAMNRYFKRKITEEQLNEIVNDIKKKQFSVEMRLKALKEKKSSHA
ncbi:MAG: PGF-pre-PGF domain-containing protein [Candidatus Aenigmarchaeota archaeon]|nr:PGF-pre-PGF domain-containing protein [Candidatus Aenigmarchaeota archaeon]